MREQQRRVRRPGRKKGRGRLDRGVVGREDSQNFSSGCDAKKANESDKSDGEESDASAIDDVTTLAPSVAASKKSARGKMRRRRR